MKNVGGKANIRGNRRHGLADLLCFQETQTEGMRSVVFPKRMARKFSVPNLSLSFGLLRLGGLPISRDDRGMVALRFKGQPSAVDVTTGPRSSHSSSFGGIEMRGKGQHHGVWLNC